MPKYYQPMFSVMKYSGPVHAEQRTLAQSRLSAEIGVPRQALCSYMSMLEETVWSASRSHVQRAGGSCQNRVLLVVECEDFLTVYTMREMASKYLDLARIRSILPRTNESSVNWHTMNGNSDLNSASSLCAPGVRLKLGDAIASSSNFTADLSHALFSICSESAASMPNDPLLILLLVPPSLTRAGTGHLQNIHGGMHNTIGAVKNLADCIRRVAMENMLRLVFVGEPLASSSSLRTSPSNRIRHNIHHAPTSMATRTAVGIGGPSTRIGLGNSPDAMSDITTSPERKRRRLVRH